MKDNLSSVINIRKILAVLRLKMKPEKNKKAEAFMPRLFYFF